MLRGVGSYVPERVVNNQHFTDYLDTSDEWIVTRTGIRERRYCAPEECTSTMAIEASRRALEEAHMSADELDVIICATATPDHAYPATAAFIQDKLGAGKIPVFDISAACSGFLYACAVGGGFVVSGMYRNALVIGAETLTRAADPQDRTMCVLFGDAAGAAVIGPAINSEQGILYWRLGCDGDKTHMILQPAGGSRLPASEATVAERRHYMKMEGRQVFKFAVNKMRELIDEALGATGISPSDLALVIPHQSNLRIIEAARERLGLPPEKMAVNIDRYGNTSAASVVLALDEARRDGTLNPGDLIMMLAIGAGLTWGVMLIRL